MPIGILLKKDDPIDLTKLMSDVKKSIKGKNCGAIVTFTGLVRGITPKGKRVDSLEYEVFEKAARKTIEGIAKTIALIEGVLEVAICHKYGTFSPGEEVLYVIIATDRSNVAMETLKLAISKAKHEIPIWKKEHTINGSYWVDLD